MSNGLEQRKVRETLVSQAQVMHRMRIDGRFCKPKVGGSIPSAGTTEITKNPAFVARSARGIRGKDGTGHRLSRPQKPERSFAEGSPVAALNRITVRHGCEPIRNQACAYFIAARENPTPENRRRAAHWLDRLEAARP